MKWLSSARAPKAVQVAKTTVGFALAWISTSPLAFTAEDQPSTPVVRVAEKRIIGPTAIVAEAETEMNFLARVDTGARTSSVHVEEWAIEDESSEMQDNIGKRIRYCIKNHEGEKQWIDSRIEAISLVKTSEQEEQRYKVEMTLCFNDVRKSIMVTLNDRSHMKYPMLLGRNFLRGDFVVDVEVQKKSAKAEVAAEPAETEVELPREVAQKEPSNVDHRRIEKL